MTPVYATWDREDSPAIAAQRRNDGRYDEWARERERRVMLETARLWLARKAAA